MSETRATNIETAIEYIAAEIEKAGKDRAAKTEYAIELLDELQGLAYAIELCDFKSAKSIALFADELATVAGEINAYTDRIESLHTTLAEISKAGEEI